MKKNGCTIIHCTIALSAEMYTSAYPFEDNKRRDGTTIILCYLFDFTWVEQSFELYDNYGFLKTKN